MDEQQLEWEKSLPASVWDNFDIGKITNAGFKLEYVRPEIEGDKLIEEIDAEDIESEIEYWKNAVVCYVLGAYPPFSVLNSYLQRIWGKHGIDKIAMLKNGIVVVRFDTEAGKTEVIQEGIFHFDNNPLIVKAWNVEMDFSKDELSTVPIWVRLPGLEFKYRSAKGLSKIGSLIGKPLMVDKNTEKKVGLHFARLLVEVKIGEQFLEVVYFKNEKGVIVEQKVTYDWKPTVCKECNKYGHTRENCRRNKEKEVKQVRENNVNKDEGNPSNRGVQTGNLTQNEVQEQIEGRKQNESGKEIENKRKEVGIGQKQGGGWNQPQNHASVPIVIKDVVAVANTFKALEGEEKGAGSQENVGSKSSLNLRDG
uniref:DUF4283 domain-containing protein n=1 Tax=Nicotiana tabacum TaxID=4097 RepID=A0A1S4ANN9_TOBAC|nr:PREDICTED: uncharacterized protein LOC107799673 [Nicotiana tabacum]